MELIRAIFYMNADGTLSQAFRCGEPGEDWTSLNVKLILNLLFVQHRSQSSKL